MWPEWQNDDDKDYAISILGVLHHRRVQLFFPSGFKFMCTLQITCSGASDTYSSLLLLISALRATYKIAGHIAAANMPHTSKQVQWFCWQSLGQSQAAGCRKLRRFSHSYLLTWCTANSTNPAEGAWSKSVKVNTINNEMSLQITPNHDILMCTQLPFLVKIVLCMLRDFFSIWSGAAVTCRVR